MALCVSGVEDIEEEGIGVHMREIRKINVCELRLG